MESKVKERIFYSTKSPCGINSIAVIVTRKLIKSKFKTPCWGCSPCHGVDSPKLMSASVYAECEGRRREPQVGLPAGLESIGRIESILASLEWLAKGHSATIFEAKEIGRAACRERG